MSVIAQWDGHGEDELMGHQVKERNSKQAKGVVLYLVDI